MSTLALRGQLAADHTNIEHFHFAFVESKHYIDFFVGIHAGFQIPLLKLFQFFIKITLSTLKAACTLLFVHPDLCPTLLKLNVSTFFIDSQQQRCLIDKLYLICVDF